MRAVVLALGAVGCATTPVAVLQPKDDVAVATALLHTRLMTEGCTAVDVGRGRVLTAKHCVDTDTVGDTLSVGVLTFVSPIRDFAVLLSSEINPDACMRPPVLGEHVYAVGYPVQLVTEKQALTVTDGVFAGPEGDNGELRFTAPIYFGNSGGGVWATDGCLVGLSVSGILQMPGMNYLVSSGDILPVL